ncbi:MAG: S-methyl-5'-thioadenosine phosphorylase [Actinomycetota bacterium]|nr:S-methyl-5'-thioadenosine phosphorylase [Actinomycetota bacterium]
MTRPAGADDTKRDRGARVGVIGGSGFYEFLDDAEEVHVSTPYGHPASPLVVGSIDGQRVAFLPRHGLGHIFAAHRVPFRANIWALHSLGVASIIAPCSVGSLQANIHPGQLVVVAQLIDRTWGRADTFHDVGGPSDVPGSTGPVHHQTFAEPYDPVLRAHLVATGASLDVDVVDGGTMVVINGPRFSTRAESAWFRAMGWHVVNMTGYPEAVLAAELDIRYATVALVTDYDAGVDGHEPVSMDAVFAMMRSNVQNVRALISAAVATMPAQLLERRRTSG